MCAVCEMRAVYQYEFKYKYKYIRVLTPASISMNILVAAGWVFISELSGDARFFKPHGAKSIPPPRWLLRKKKMDGRKTPFQSGLRFKHCMAIQ